MPDVVDSSQPLHGTRGPFGQAKVLEFWRDVAFLSLWLFVMAVSTFDSMLSVNLRHLMNEMELNPVGQFFLQLQEGQVGYLVLAKVLGTLLASTVVLVIYWRRPARGLAVVFGMAAFQLGLLLFLLFG